MRIMKCVKTNDRYVFVSQVSIETITNHGYCATQTDEVKPNVKVLPKVSYNFFFHFICFSTGKIKIW